ncbi:MAG TPA: transposase [Steroidobacteraceae bacterium]|nr:transposase [Steroidobacteraceae bacterium]
MPRAPRLHAPGAVYHVTARGNHRQDIFYKLADRQLLDEIMADAVQRTGARVHAYCWMTNHVHLLVQVAEQPLGNLMQRVAGRFARAIQKDLSTTGHLFENRYHALLVDVDHYFLELIRYIHLNPVRAHICEAPQQYRWSSHRAYLGKSVQPWVYTDFGLSLFSPDLARARVLFQSFVEQRLSSADADLRLAPHPKERRVLGTDQFLEQLALHASTRRSSVSLESLAQAICNERRISLEALRSRSRERHLCDARALIASRAIAQQAASLSAVARFLNRSVSALSRAVSRMPIR